MFKNMNKSNYDTFDPDNYDPKVMRRYNGADGSSDASGSFVQEAKPGNKMQVNLTLSNPTASDLTLELFSFLDSFTRRQKLEYAVGNYLYIPQESYEGIKAIAAGTDQTVGWDKQGNCVIRGLLADPKATIGCAEIAYNAFFEASGITAFTVAYFRATFSNNASIDQKITYFERTFSGGVKENPISPRAYFKPTQFQDLTIDITVSFSIGIDKGLKTVVLAGQSVKLNLFIQMWTNQTLSA